MTYQALARKWRPGRFADVKGQEHVVTALSYALDQDRVHHAFLFTGTRGVGKTTLARLLAKALNCEQGVSSTPCGECSSCQSVEQGRFVDLLEVDAASRTRVDDTRELLDNVQYAPTMGRYKVYLIDEVHMLSGHSFNALLKTLEEPPPHVKFLLATTDPQKLPPTILSRCLQFNLRALQVNEIAAQMGSILDAESIEYEMDALNLLARSARGSMRDGLSLLDQSIAFSGSRVEGDAVRSMLGMIDSDYIAGLIEAIATSDGTALFAVIEVMRERNIDFASALDEVILLLHEIALIQQVPQVMQERGANWSQSEQLATDISAEMVQLYYQIAMLGKKDLSIVSDAARGFEMVFLRMLAFEPAKSGKAGFGSTPNMLAKKTISPTSGPATKSAVNQTKVDSVQEPQIEEKSAAPENFDPVVSQPEETVPVQQAGGKITDSSSWGRFVENSGLMGIARELSMNLAFGSMQDGVLILQLDQNIGYLNSPTRLKNLQGELETFCGQPIKLLVEPCKDISTIVTPAQQREKRLKAEKSEALEGMINDPVVNNFIREYGAEVVPDSIEPATQRGV